MTLEALLDGMNQKNRIENEEAHDGRSDSEW